MFSKYCQQQYTVEQCEVENSSGQINLYPILKSRFEKVNVNKINKMVGIDEDPRKVADLLTRMCLTASVDESGDISVILTKSCNGVLGF